jgi:hypothetical protein
MSTPEHTTSRFEDEGIPDPEDQTPEQAATGQGDLTTEPPHDYPLAVEGFGTTPAEMHDGESLTGRLAREVPEEDPYRQEPRDVGRLVEPDEGARTDTDKDMIAVDDGELGGLTAEEAAMHLEPEA